jgi:flagellar biosynthesis anti-sigma factor FlgM
MSLNRIQQDMVRLYGGRSQGVRGGGKTPNPASAGAEDATASARGDDVVFSESASALRAAFGHAKSAADVREAYVAELRGQVQAGTYRVPAEALSRRLVEAGVLE